MCEVGRLAGDLAAYLLVQAVCQQPQDWSGPPLDTFIQLGEEILGGGAGEVKKCVSFTVQ